MPENMTVAVSGGYNNPEDRYGKILIMGRSQSGKTTIAKRLAEMTGLKILKTSTSRPKRSPDEDTYHFYTPEEAAGIPIDQKLFHTIAVDGFERWTDKNDFLDAGIAILDPTGAEPAVRLWQAQGFKVTVLYCDEPDEIRRTRWMKELASDDGSDWDVTLVNFNHREATETPMFDEFERAIRQVEEMYDSDALLYPNAAPQHYAAIGEDRLERVRPGDTDMSQFLSNFIGRLAGSGGRQAIRDFSLKNNTVVRPQDCPQDKWAFLCRLLGLLPENTAYIQITRPHVRCHVRPLAYSIALSEFDTDSEKGDT